MLGILLFIIILDIFVAGSASQPFIAGFAGITAVLLGLLFIIMLVFFFVRRSEAGLEGLTEFAI